MNTPFNPVQPLAPRASRRRAVAIGAVGLLLTFAAVFVQAIGMEGDIGKAMAVIGIIVMVFGWARLLMPGSGLPQFNQPDLDERQRAVITDAYATAYRIVTIGLIATALYFLLTDLIPMLPTLGTVVDKTLLMVALIWTVIGLPPAILAWNEPDTD